MSLFLAIAISARGGAANGPEVIRGALASQSLIQRSLETARDMSADPRVAVSVDVRERPYFVHEPIRLRVRIAVERAFLAQSMVQLFARPLDVPVQLQARWLDDLPGASVLACDGGAPIATTAGSEASTGSTAATTFALGETVAIAPRGPDDLTGGNRVAVIEIERTFAAQQPGRLAIPETVVLFAFATQFQDDLVNGRVAKDRIDAFVRSGPIALDVVALPEQGRPTEFTGAVGRFTIAASATPRAVAVGESFKLSLEIGGEGNFHDFEAPELRELQSFTVLGKVEHEERARRVITYDVSPRGADASEVPPIAFAYFDPTPPGTYRRLKTSPIRIDVRASADSSSGASSVRARSMQESLRSTDAASASTSRERGGSSFPFALWIALIVPSAVAIAVAVRARRASRAAVARDERDASR